MQSSVMSDSLWPHGLRSSGLLCPPVSPGICSNSGPLSWWWFCSSSQTMKALEMSISVIVITYTADYRTGRLSLQCNNGSHVLSTDHMVTLCCLFTRCFTHSIQNNVKQRAGTQKYLLMDGWMSALLSDNILSVRFDYHPYYLNEKTVAYTANWCVSRLLSS